MNRPPWQRRHLWLIVALVAALSLAWIGELA